MTEIVVQSRHQPEGALRALEGLITSETLIIRVAVAYITTSGSQTLIDELRAKVGESAWCGIEKIIVSCVDYGFTQPEALRLWIAQPNTSVFLQNSSMLVNSNLQPTHAFHSKYYEFREGDCAQCLIGSSNLTERALTSNTEALVVMRSVESLDELDRVWSVLTDGAVQADHNLVDNYDLVRQRNLPPRASSPVQVSRNRPSGTLWSAIEEGICRPVEYENFWVDAGSMSSGGSHNQLELPRGANNFFEFTFDSYDDAPKKIGQPTLLVGSNSYRDRTLRWHGSNMMERLNLPTGVNYSNMIVLFRRQNNGFRIYLASVGNDRAATWQNASEAIDRRYRLGASSRRACGFF